MASGAGEYMTIKGAIAIRLRAYPSFCPKCGSKHPWDVRDDGYGCDELVCIFCGWIYYLTEAQSQKFKGLDKAKCGKQN